MAFSEFEVKRLEKNLNSFIEKIRPEPHIRKELDFGFEIKGQSVELFEVRPNFLNPSEKICRPYAKTTYVKKRALWKIYWQRADLRWHGYEPVPEVRSIEEFLEVVGDDRYCCFFG